MTLYPPDSLCLVRLSALGDVINAVPIMRTLQRYWPETQLTWVVGAREAALVGDLPGIRCIPYEKESGWRGIRELRRRFTGQRFDVLLQMQYALRANLVGASVPARLRIGYDRERTREGHRLFIHRRIGEPKSPHVVDIYFAFLEALGITERVLDWSVPIPDRERSAIDRMLRGKGPFLVISPCGSSEFRDWRPERYAAVADYAAIRHGYSIALSGGRSSRERELANAIKASMRVRPIDLVGRTSLKGLLALLDRADLLITPDSGPAHMANATNTDVIALLATSDSKRSGPYRSLRWCVDRYDAAARRFAGKPAAELPWGKKFESPGAMDLIEVGDVIERLDALLAHRRRSDLESTGSRDRL